MGEEMRVYISVDMEGVSNVVMPYQWHANDAGSYPEIKELATREVNSAIEGAAKGGATEFIVNENHSGKEMIPELLDKRAVLLSGQGKCLETVHGIERTDALFLTGIHPRMGVQDGVCDHTWMPKVFYEFRVNDKPVGEIGLNALVAGHFDIPTTLVTGCKAACEEAIDLLGEVETVAVKEGVGRYAAFCPHPEINREKIREAAERAVTNHKQFKACKMETPYRLEWDLLTQQQANEAERITEVQRMAARRIGVSVDNFEDGMRLFNLVSVVTASGSDPVMG
jgi:D-amino peptidase